LIDIISLPLRAAADFDATRALMLPCRHYAADAADYADAAMTMSAAIIMMPVADLPFIFFAACHDTRHA